jgi:hypothetical protein
MTRLAVRRRFLKIVRQVDAAVEPERQAQRDHDARARARQRAIWRRQRREEA